MSDEANTVAIGALIGGSIIAATYFALILMAIFKPTVYHSVTFPSQTPLSITHSTKKYPKKKKDVALECVEYA